MKKIFLFLISIFIFFLRPIEGDGDFYHHAAIGKFVVEHLTLPHFDQFTFTAAGKGFIAYAWASGVIYHLILNHFGEIGISVFNALVAAVTFGLLYKFLRIISVSKLTAFILVTFAAVTSSIRWPHRPEIFTYPFLISILLIDKLREKSGKLVFVFPIIILLWANLYGSSVILGLIILSLIAIKQFHQDQFKFKLKSLYIAFALSIIASYLNGYGLKSIFYIFYIPQVRNNVGEWFGIFETFSKAPTWYLAVFYFRLWIYLIYLIAVSILIAINLKRLKVNYLFSLLALGVFIPFIAFRHVPLAVILSIPLLSILIDKMKARNKVLSFICLAIIISLGLNLYINKPSLNKEGPFPKKIIDFIKDKHLSGKAFNTQPIGGFLTYYLYPQILVTIDTRDDLFIGNPIIKDQQNILIPGIDVLHLLAKYNINLVVGNLSETKSYESLFHSNRWKIVFLEKDFFVAVPSKTAQ